MSSRIIENIIKNFINELAGKIDLKIRALTDKDRTFLTQDAIPLLGVKTADRENYKKVGGVVIEATRKFGREVDATTDKKSFTYTPAEVKNDIRSMLNSLRSIWQPMKKAGYVWLVTTDITPVAPDAKSKAEKIISKYEFLCIYVSQDALQKNIDSSITGYLYSLDEGALVFDWNSIDANQWKRTAKVSAEKGSGTNFHAPYNTAKFGDRSKVVDDLYLYFELDKLGWTPSADSQFNCEVKSVIEWFQRTNKIPVTGQWDLETRDLALALKTYPYPIPTESYNEIRSAADACKLSNGFVPVDIQNIEIPEGGFRFGIVKDLNFWPVQLAMLKTYEQLATSYPQLELLNDEVYTKFKRAIGTAENPGEFRGDYGDVDLTMVTFLKNGFGMTSSPKIVEEEFINKLYKA